LTNPVHFLLKQDLGYTKDGPKSAINLKVSMNNLIAQAKSKGFNPHEIVFDSESGIATNRGSIECSCNLRQLPQGTHDGSFNKAVQDLKNRVRTLAMSVSKKLPLCQMMFCFFFLLAMFSMNISPTNANPHRVSAFRAATDFQLDFNLIGKGVVGDIVEARSKALNRLARTEQTKSARLRLYSSRQTRTASEHIGS